MTTFESRLSAEITGLIERLGGVARSAPAMRELPTPESPDAMAFAERLIDGSFDMVILLTGVGVRTLMSIIESNYPRERIVAELRKTRLIARGHKPADALREWGLKPDVIVPEPATWRELLAVLDDGEAVAGKRVAIQEYGVPNDRLAEALHRRGAEVTSVAVYAWALPEDLEPLRSAIQAITAGKTDVVVFTTAQQVRNMLQVAADMGLDTPLRKSLRRVLIASIGPLCSEALRDAGLGVDFEPDRVKMGHMMRELARSAAMLLQRKRSSHQAKVDTTTMRRIDGVWPKRQRDSAADLLHDSAFLRACRREATDRTPIWLMRQAGRYQRAYREIRAKVSFLDLCRTPELAAEVTLMAVEQLGVDAAIIFSDILLILEPMGVGLTYGEGEGPRIERPVRCGDDVDRLREVAPGELQCVYDAVRLARRALRPDIPLIGFCGAPFTLASYLLEGGSGGPNCIQTKAFMYRDAAAWYALMDHLSRALAGYLNSQIDAGAQAVQLFDSWVGCLSEAEYREFVLPHVKSLIDQVKPSVPVLHFGTNTGLLLEAMQEAGGEVIGLDWRVDLAQAWARLHHDVAVQGNLDPAVLLATPSEIRKRARMVLDKAAGRAGHIFNLGHGVLPSTPVDHVLALVDAVHEYRPG